MWKNTARKTMNGGQPYKPLAYTAYRSVSRDATAFEDSDGDDAENDESLDDPPKKKRQFADSSDGDEEAEVDADDTLSNNDSCADGSSEEEDGSGLLRATVGRAAKPPPAKRRTVVSATSVTKAAVQQVLAAITSAASGAVTCGGVCSELSPLPGLIVRGKFVALPLDDEAGRRLYETGVISPHGHGMATVVDAAVRSSREFAPVRMCLLEGVSSLFNAAVV